MPSIFKNFIIFLAIALAITAVYVFFIKDSGPESNLVSSVAANVVPTAPSVGATSSNSEDNLLAEDFLALLLSVKNIKLDNSIFDDVAFNKLRDSTIVITQSGGEGRPNPFAQFGTDSIEVSASQPVAPASSSTPTNSPTPATDPSTAPSSSTPTSSTPTTPSSTASTTP